MRYVTVTRPTKHTFGCTRGLALGIVPRIIPTQILNHLLRRRARGRFYKCLGCNLRFEKTCLNPVNDVILRERAALVTNGSYVQSTHCPRCVTVIVRVRAKLGLDYGEGCRAVYAGVSLHMQCQAHAVSW